MYTSITGTMRGKDMYSLVYFLKKEFYMSIKKVHYTEFVRIGLCAILGDYLRFNIACLCRNSIQSL